MNKVLVSEVLFAKGHVKLNENYIKCIGRNFDVTIMDDGNYFPSIETNGYSHIYKSHYMVKRGETIKRLLYALYLRKVAKTAKQLSIRNIVLLSFHTEAFGLVYRSFRGINVCAVHHYDIDRMTKRPQEVKAFDKYKNQITHCVLEDFIAEGLINDFAVASSRVCVVNTPVEIVKALEENSTKNIFIGIGQSTDQALIDELIELDKSHYLPNDIIGKIILRSKTTQYDGIHVKVFTGFLERDEYDDLYKSATACIVRYEPTYRLRSSGSVDDAFRNHKKIIVMGFPAGQSYAQMFPRNCVCVNRTEDILDLLKGATLKYDENEGARFETDHSFDNVTKQWKSAIVRNEY